MQKAVSNEAMRLIKTIVEKTQAEKTGNLALHELYKFVGMGKHYGYSAASIIDATDFLAWAITRRGYAYDTAGNFHRLDAALPRNRDGFMVKEYHEFFKDLLNYFGEFKKDKDTYDDYDIGFADGSWFHVTDFNQQKYPLDITP